MATTPFAYHSDENEHGSYQYLTLKEIVNWFEEESMDDNSMLKNIKRSTFVRHAKDGIRKLNKRVFKDILAAEITVPDGLFFALPHNYVNWVRCSLVVEDEDTPGSFKLHELNRNQNMNFADGYLQDHNGEIIFDHDGNIILVDASNVYNKPYKKYVFDNNLNIWSPTKDTSKFSKYGEFAIDERNGKIVFSSNLNDKEIVLEYLSDGLSFDVYGEGRIRVHKDGIETLKDWIYFCCIRWKDGVPRDKRIDALRRFKTTRHEAKLNRMNFNLLEIERTMRSSSKNI